MTLTSGFKASKSAAVAPTMNGAVTTPRPAQNSQPDGGLRGSLLLHAAFSSELNSAMHMQQMQVWHTWHAYGAVEMMQRRTGREGPPEIEFKDAIRSLSRPVDNIIDESHANDSL